MAATKRRRRRAKWKEHRHLTMAMLDPTTPVVKCRAATLTALQHTSGCSPNELPDPEDDPSSDDHDARYDSLLRTDLKMSPLLLKTLAPQFSAIARVFKPTATVTQGQCVALRTVTDAVALVRKAAGL
jgi:hypothetical protein